MAFDHCLLYTKPVLLVIERFHMQSMDVWNVRTSTEMDYSVFVALRSGLTACEQLELRLFLGCHLPDEVFIKRESYSTRTQLYLVITLHYSRA